MQCVMQVQKVLKNLTIEGGLQEDHLELLWNLTEKVGAIGKSLLRIQLPAPGCMKYALLWLGTCS